MKFHGDQSTNKILFIPLASVWSQVAFLQLLVQMELESPRYLRMLYRFIRPRSGIVQLEGDNIWQIDAKTCAQRIAVVLQEQPVDLALTVREVVFFRTITTSSNVCEFWTTR